MIYLILVFIFLILFYMFYILNKYLTYVRNRRNYFLEKARNDKMVIK